MIWATEYKHIELVKLLLAKGSDINIRDNVRFFLKSVSEISHNLCLKTKQSQRRQILGSVQGGAVVP